MKTTKEIIEDSKKYSKAAFDNQDAYEFITNLFNTVKDSNNWKLPTQIYYTEYETFASQMFAAICFFLGGAEIEYNKVSGKYVITSKGYYHYVGA